MRRFWNIAAAAKIEGGWTVTLDGRPVRTPACAAFALPTAALAEAIAAEWAAVDGDVRPAAMPLTGLANAAIDRADVLAPTLAAYARTDLLCYRAETPPELARLQAERWDPPLAWATQRFDVAFTVTQGIVHRSQPVATIERLDAAVAALDRWRLAGLHPVVTITGSLVLGLALLEGTIDAATAWASGQLDELWQAQKWGEDTLAAATRAERRAELDAATRMLELVR